MKKSMFITTIMMVVLLVVALSTATFAWYTAQTNATVSETTVTSATSSTASLVIDTVAATTNAADNTTVTINMAQIVSPMIYGRAAAPTKDTTYDSFKDSFVTFNITADGKYVDNPEKTAPAVISKTTGKNNAETTTGDFYVTNIGGVAAKVNATVSINPDYYVKVTVKTGDAVDAYYTLDEDGTYTQATGNAVAGTDYYAKRSNEHLRVAMFVDGKYVATWAMNSKNKVGYYGYITTSEDGDTLPKDLAQVTKKAHNSYTASDAGSGVEISATLGSMTAIRVQLVAWFEGDDHTNAYAGSSASFSIEFGAENIA